MRVVSVDASKRRRLLETTDTLDRPMEARAINGCQHPGGGQRGRGDAVAKRPEQVGLDRAKRPPALTVAPVTASPGRDLDRHGFAGEERGVDGRGVLFDAPPDPRSRSPSYATEPPASGSLHRQARRLSIQQIAGWAPGPRDNGPTQAANNRVRLIVRLAFCFHAADAALGLVMLLRPHRPQPAAREDPN